MCDREKGDTDAELAQAADPCEAPPIIPTGRVVDCTGAITVELPTCGTPPPEPVPDLLTKAMGPYGLLGMFMDSVEL